MYRYLSIIYNIYNVHVPSAKLSLLSVQHLHEQGGVGRVALHVLEVEEVLAPLGHGAQLGQQSHQLVVLLLRMGRRLDRGYIGQRSLLNVNSSRLS